MNHSALNSQCRILPGGAFYEEHSGQAQDLPRVFYTCNPSERGKRASSSGVELFGTEQPGVAMYLAPACVLASVHCFRISVVVNFSKSISSTPPTIGCEYCLRTSEIGNPLVFTEY